MATLKLNNGERWLDMADRMLKRSGRTKTIPLDELQKEFIAYVKSCAENPVVLSQRVKQHQKGKGKNKNGEGDVDSYGDLTQKIAPMTERAFCAWIGKSQPWLAQTIRDLKKRENPTDEDKDYLEFLLDIQNFFHAQLLDGGMLGEYAPNIVAALVGLKNNIDVTSDDKPVATPTVTLIKENRSREEIDSEE